MTKPQTEYRYTDIQKYTQCFLSKKNKNKKKSFCLLNFCSSTFACLLRTYLKIEINQRYNCCWTQVVLIGSFLPVPEEPALLQHMYTALGCSSQQNDYKNHLNSQLATTGLTSPLVSIQFCPGAKHGQAGLRKSLALIWRGTFAGREEGWVRKGDF